MKPTRKPPPARDPRQRGAAGLGLAHLFHLDLLVVDLFEVKDLRRRFDHLTGGRRGGGRGGGCCRHDPPRRPGDRARPPARAPPFSPEPRSPAARRSVARDRPGPPPSPGFSSSALSVAGPRPPHFQFRLELGTGREEALLRNRRREFCDLERERGARLGVEWRRVRARPGPEEQASRDFL